MGRPKKPNDLKKRDGDRKDRINDAEPQSPNGLPEPPAWLDDLGQEAYRTLAARLVEMKLDRVADAEALTIYAVNYSLWRQCVDGVKGCLDIVCDNGIVKANPLLQQLNQSQRTMTALLQQMGFTPAARASLRLEQNQNNALIEFMANAPR